MYVVSPIFFAYEQSELNKVWGSEGGPVPDDSGAYEAPRLESAEQPPVGSTTTTTPADVSPERPPQ